MLTEETCTHGATPTTCGECTDALVFADPVARQAYLENRDARRIKEVAWVNMTYDEIHPSLRQALGTFEGFRKAGGALSDLSVFSFHPVKPITTGEGGAILTDNESFYKKLLLLRSHGVDCEVLGKGRLYPLVCAVGERL